ncbi:MAG TPA: oligopeptide transporter, OPT family [Candidatus Binataceae bacterium]|nr:oligopeptide transporter, OPT family [Candidatus Binataceae bacterium]
MTRPLLKTTPAPLPTRELTVRSLLLGAILAVVLGAANAYLGLYAGMTVSASIPAAVLSMALLRVLGGSTILENNVVQTVASAGEAVAAGAIFTFPALVILGERLPLSYWRITTLSLAGGTMGSLLVVFLRRAFIVEERLAFPEGRACAEVLRAGAEDSSGAGLLTLGGLVAAILKALQDVVGVLPGVAASSRWIGGAPIALSANLSAALIGVGYILGIEIAVLVLLGGLIAWLVAIPLLSLRHPELRMLAPAAAATQLWSADVRYLGVGAMLMGGAATLFRLRHAIARGMREGFRMIRAGAAAPTRSREETDLSAGVVLGATALCVPAIALIVWRLSGSLTLSLILAAALAFIGFFATAVAGYLTGIVGASNNPVSGVTIIVLLALALLLKFAGLPRALGAHLAILTGAVVCTAAAMAGDSLHDLATGFHLRATPRALEIAVLCGAMLSAFLMAPLVNLLIRGYGIAGLPGAGAHALPAPQAFLMAKVAQGVFQGALPWTAILAGVLLAAACVVGDALLERRRSRWRLPVMPVAIGLYLPFGLGVTIFLGAVLRAIASRSQLNDARRGTLLAAGLIAGEALTGVAVGAMIVAGLRLPLL